MIRGGADSPVSSLCVGKRRVKLQRAGHRAQGAGSRAAGKSESANLSGPTQAKTGLEWGTGAFKYQQRRFRIPDTPKAPAAAGAFIVRSGQGYWGLGVAELEGRGVVACVGAGADGTLDEAGAAGAGTPDFAL